jgi:hypothetical protein
VQVFDGGGFAVLDDPDLSISHSRRRVLREIRFG